jgi:hypothetical protein
MKTYELVLRANRAIKDGRLTQRFVQIINDVMAGDKAATKYLTSCMIEREIIPDPKREQRGRESMYRSERQAEIDACENFG